ncbi:MAG TPA: lipid-A-disaccharide synthase [Gammaproteobacteria bacterium]|jgi:lipid-A-disaccharide synthase|nr:lipid-A-disaccharide synthase [Gammaproteobacteria bacterium]
MLRIGIVAGESSGDILGANLIRALRARVPDAQFEGVTGPEMVAAGCKTIASAEELSIMGLVEVLRHLPRLLWLRRRLRKHFLANRPDVFIGIDSPDFNLGLEEQLHKRGICTVHYVSPSVWAWRERRIFKVGRAADLVLTLLPFEPAFYEKHGFKAEFVGHPLADQAPATIDRVEQRKSLHLPCEGPLVALLPGSRSTEVERLGPLFLDTAQWLSEKMPELRFVIPAATNALSFAIKKQIRMLKPDLPVTVVDGHSREVMSAVDVVLLASGTATLEAMLSQCPMVVAYRLAGLTHAVIRGCGLLKVPYVSLPNLLAGREVVPELLQYEATSYNVGEAVLELLQNAAARRIQLDAFREITAVLRRNAGERAAEAILKLLSDRPVTTG